MIAGRALAAPLALALALPALSLAPPPARAQAAATLQPIDEVQRDDIIVQTIGWNLAHANARFCARVAPGIGVMLQDARTFDDPALARQVYGLSGDIGVGALAADGPAHAAGLPLNATITAVGSLAVASLPVPRQGKWDRLFALQDALEKDVARDGRVVLALAQGKTMTIPGAPVCQVRFLMDDSKGNAGANRDVVRIGRPMAEVAKWDETEIAALMAHELAHAVLDHQTWLEQGGSTRKTEREADRLSVWLLHNAGYDPAAAMAWMRRIGPRYEILFIASPDHGSWRTRVRDMTAEIATMKAATANAAQADWPRLFRREEGAPAMPVPAAPAMDKPPMALQPQPR
ncbi:MULTISPECIES: hypothetical protein [unclassified Novosphingobium]|uniref:hypothetical protein n=1 Tax=unclassified Novosphingobium TaxID=2644732 RepID=UPI00146DA1D3|nr:MULTISPECIES: hypothetical protein [unclassified Novosphingobium]NMN05629.1 hypothetical protein [Novosphingobium sp. SG919]NMN88011.1 hypothetical protein [Novosphingobium sp. SG916]